MSATVIGYLVCILVGMSITLMAAGIAAHGESSPEAAGLSEAHERRPVQGADRTAGTAQVTEARMRAADYAALRDSSRAASLAPCNGRSL